MAGSWDVASFMDPELSMLAALQQDVQCCLSSFSAWPLVIRSIWSSLLVKEIYVIVGGSELQ
jgi:hypothetical protein